jgi:hypothetical protein
MMEDMNQEVILSEVTNQVVILSEVKNQVVTHSEDRNLIALEHTVLVDTNQLVMAALVVNIFESLIIQ